jgi:enoyl-CoA hydratase/carnithine racemase
MRRRAGALLAELAVDAGCRAVVLTGAGGHFCAGADLSRVDEGAPHPGPLALRENQREVLLLIERLVSGPKPVVAAVEGLAVGGGLSMALACDHVVAARTARLGTAFSRIGIIGDMGILWTLKERVGLAAAKRLLALSSQLSGEEAHALGMVDELAEEGGALAAAQAMARRYAEAAPLSVAYVKAAYGQGINTLADACRAELDYLPLVTQSNDFRNAVAAFKKKVPPVFTGS